MGVEYRIRPKQDHKHKIEKTLRLLPWFSGICPDSGLYEYRNAEDNLSQMPEAYADIEEDYVYFCDNGNYGSTILGRIWKSTKPIHAIFRHPKHKD